MITPQELQHDIESLALDEIQDTIADNHIRIVHLFNKKYPYGGCTIAYAPEVYDSQGYPRGKFAKVAVAWCSNRDRYSRPLGEYLAVSKWANGETVVLPIYVSGHPVRQLKLMFFDLVAQDSY